MQEALNRVTATLAQCLLVCGGLHALCHHLEAKLVRERDDAITDVILSF